MLKRLQQHFIMTNMALVSIVLSIVFAILYMNSYSSSLMEIDNSLGRSIDFVQKTNLPMRSFSTTVDTHSSLRPKNNIPSITVQIDKDGQVTQIYQDLINLPNDEIMEIMEHVSNAYSTRGYVAGTDWRYLRISSQGNSYISIASTVLVKLEMKKVFFITMVLACGTMVVFFFISLLLAKLAIAPVKKAWRQQQQFVADASHELKTPLTVILANNNILLSQENTTIKSQAKWVKSTQTEAIHMKHLIDNLLYLARADAEKTPIITEDVSLSDTLTDCILQFEPIAFEKSLTLESEIQQDIFIKGNSTQLKQLAHILVDNACKYSNPGDKVFALLKKSNGLIQISVNNNGAIISQEDLPHIFERFYRSDKARTQNPGQGGYGLGLAIAKNIVEMHKGKISVTSIPGEGTTFTVTIRTIPYSSRPLIL